ncbi:DUF2007 domain-containing protein [Cytophagales bacterium LB-30]|uniref:DUF2007 domain-containing protein n=1 Tax=Shiella aurantiaca TaxID=3058365 RepID=A0ABT8F6H9_9BACT|nr:DUF2007 domain-containing protein [Shiella aurantiaca]MDN4166077.1 DUF2007 domain-containing protein [Shiella aurantiaca]
MKNWKKVFEAPILHRAEIVKAVLEDHDMFPVIIDKKDSSYLFGHYEVMVEADHVLRAIKIIEDDIRFE